MKSTITLIISFVALAPSMLYAKDCIPTPHRTTGTHYKPVTEQKTNISKGVMVNGVVLNSACQPIANAKVAHWQAGEDGRYADSLRAYLFTDKEGRYQFETEWPALNPPHIHFSIEAKGFELLETQWIGNDRMKKIKFDMVLEKKIK